MLPPGIYFRYGWKNCWGVVEEWEQLPAQSSPAMLGLSRGSCSPSVSRVWQNWLSWKLEDFFILLLFLLEGAGCLASPASPSSTTGVNGNNRPGINVYMNVEEVKKLLGKKLWELGRGCFERRQPTNIFNNWLTKLLFHIWRTFHFIKRQKK